MATLGTAHEQYCTLYNTIRLLKYISYIVQSKLAIHSKKNCNAITFPFTYIHLQKAKCIRLIFLWNYFDMFSLTTFPSYQYQTFCYLLTI